MSGKYSRIIDAKDGNLIPICENSSGKEVTLHSKYNPIREAENFASNLCDTSSFFVILGLAGGYHILKILEKNPQCRIFVVENSDSDIDFLSQIPCVRNLFSEKRVKISSVKNLSEDLLRFYKPALYGNITILSLRSWEEIFCDEAAFVRKKISETIKILGADYSVQSHFGKIWQKNILTNLKIAASGGKILKKFLNASIFNAGDEQKIAAVIAAGPSLDESIFELKNNRKKYFIIATDTAFSSLLKQDLISDAVVSIDGQMVSHEHYLEKLPSEVLYAFDLCANPASVQKAKKNSGRILFFETGHPLSQYASFFDGNENFLHLEAGSGTVTIAAASLASCLGFRKIQFFGADFSYIGGKPYCRGTYLESKFNSNSSRLNPAEKSYVSLMYRTPVIKLSENKITTEILRAYENSLADFMKRISVGNANAESQTFLERGEVNGNESFDYESFKTKYCKELRETFGNGNYVDENSNAFMTLLPLIAKLGKNFSFVAYLKKLEYNR